MSQIAASAFQPYIVGQASTITPGPLALYTVSVGSIDPTQEDEGFAEVGKKAAGFDLNNAAQLQASLLASIEPVVIGPGGQLYVTDGHHTFTALDDSIYGSATTVYINVIANYSNLTTAQFFATLQANNLLLPLNNGVPQTVNDATGAPIPTTLTALINDPYRGLEYSILKNKNSKLFTTTANITGAIGASTPGTDKMTGFYEDFLNAAAYRGAYGGLGLPYISPGDIALATQWNLNPASQTTLPNVAGMVTAAQLPGFILAQSYTLSGVISNTTLAGGALDGNGTFTGITTINAGTATNPIIIGTPNTGFIMQVGADKGFTVTLGGANTYTGGTSILAGTLIVANDGALGAAPTGATIDTTNLKTSVQAANGIVFNSLTEGNGTLQLGTAVGGGTATFASARAIAVGGEAATINLNGYLTTLTGGLYSLGTAGIGIGNATGFSDLTIDDNSANKGVLTLSTASPNFYGNLIIGNTNKPTVKVMSDAALGATAAGGAPAGEIGQVNLNGGILQAGASFSASDRDIFLSSGSTIDTAGFTTSWGTLTDVQRTLTIANSNTTTPGNITFASFTADSTATFALTGSETTTFTGGILRSGPATLVFQPTAGKLGASTATSGYEQVLSGTGAASVVDGIAPAWMVTNNGTAAGPYDFLTYGATGYVTATYGATTLSSTTGTSAVKLGAAQTASGNLAAYALHTNGKALTLGTNTLAIGDGTAADQAGLILATGSSIAGGTLAFNGSEGVIWSSGTTATISSAITGGDGLTFGGAGAVTLSTAATVTGAITIGSGTVTLAAANIFAGDASGVLLQDTKSTPAPAVLAITANNVLASLNSVGNNSTVSISNGASLTIGDANNANSTLSSTITETGTGVAGALTKAGSGLLDISAGKLTLTAGGSVAVTGGALRTAVGTSGSANYVLSNGADLQFAQNGGGKYSGAVTGAGTLHLIGGTLQLTGTANTYSGGTIVETGSTLDLTTANVSTGNANITDAGGLVVFDQATTGIYTGVISDGMELGTGPMMQGSLDKDDSSGANGGNVTLSAAQTYTGATYVEAGTLTLGIANAIATSSGVTLGRVGAGATATLALSANEQVASLSSDTSSTTSVVLNGNMLTVAPGASVSSTFGGTIVNGSAVGSLTKTGAGTLVLTGANAYTGGTTLANGILELASATASGGTTAAPGAIAFSGTATLQLDSVALAVGGTYAGSVGGFVAGDTLDLRSLADTAAATAQLSGTTLTIGDATDGTETLGNFSGQQGSYKAVSDGQGGTDVTFIGPAITSEVSSPMNGDLKAGTIVTFTIATSEAVTATGSALTLSNGATASYASGNGTTTPLVYSYTVASSDTNTADLRATAISGTITDSAGTALDTTTFTAIDTKNQIDTTAPTVTASAASATVEATSSAGAVETFTGSATDAVDGTDTVTYAEQVGTTLTAVTSGQTFAIGPHTIVASATDKAGNTGTSSFTFSVVDTTAPVVTASANAATVQATSANGAVETFTGSATDAVDGTDTVTYAEQVGTTLTAVTSGQTFAIGPHTIVASATDKAGNTGTSSFTFSVVDTTAPVVTASANAATVQATSANGAVETFSGSATDAVDGTDTVTYAEQVGATLTPVTSGETFAIGPHTIVASATDKAGNTGTSSFTFSVVDTTAPVVTASANAATVQATSANGAVETFTGSATDAVDGTDTVTYAEQVGTMLTPVTSGQTFAIGPHTIVASATDKAGNTGTSSFTFSVVDTTAPVVTASANAATVQATSANGAVETFTGSATDAVDGTDTVTYAEQVGTTLTAVTSGQTFAIGPHTIVASATDKAGNTGTSSFTFSVVDTTAPTVTASANAATVQATSANGAVETFTGSATDAVDGTDTVTYAEQVGATLTPVTSGETFAIGPHTIVASATDKAGNTGTSSFTFSVVDTTAPVVTASANAATVQATSANGAVETFTGSATDAVDGTDTVTYAEQVGATLTPVTSGQTFAIGPHTIVASATDKAGNTGTSSFTFSVVDTTAPVVTASAASATVQATSASGAVETFTGSATDAVDGTDTVTYAEQVGTTLTAVTSGQTFAIGPHTIVASATDKAGNTGTSSFTFSVVDTTAPVVTASANAATVQATSANGAVETFTGSATDAVDGTDTVTYAEQVGTTLTTVTSGQTFAIGPHTIVASATDKAGNTGTSSFTFSVTAAGQSGVAEDGYIAGATVFADANGNGKLDPGEVSATTDANGNFTLVGGSGPLVLTGGTDITTKLAFTGTLQAPAGASVVSPLTTIVQAVATTQGLSAAAANASVTASLGLPAGTSLTTLDAETGAMAGNATATAVFAAQTQAANAFSLITGAGGNLASSGAQAAIASAFTTNTSVLTNATALAALAMSAGVTAANAAAVGDIGSASNAFIATTAASGSSAATTVATIAAAATVAQGAATTSLMQAVANPSTLAATTAAYTGNALLSATTQAGGTLTAPDITLSGIGGTITTVDPTISGTVDLADASGTVQIYENGTAVGTPVAVSAQGTFSTVLALPGDGTYVVVAEKANASGVVGTSNAVALTLNSTANETLFGTVTHDVTSAGGQIYALYETILGRAPDALGDEGWVAALNAGSPLTTIAQDFLSSSEYASDYGSSVQSNTAFIDQLYQDGLHRQPDPSGARTWGSALSSGQLTRAQVAVDIATSPESQQDLAPTFQTGVFAPNATDSAIARLYQGLLDRAPDAGGLANWESFAQQGGSLTTIAADFIASAEYAGLHGTQSNSAFVAALYQGALGRGEDAGAATWVNALNGGASRASVALGIAESPEAVAHLAPAIESGFHIA